MDSIRVQPNDEENDIRPIIMAETIQAGLGYAVNEKDNELVDIIILKIAGFDPDTKENRLTNVAIHKGAFETIINAYIRRELSK